MRTSSRIWREHEADAEKIVVLLTQPIICASLIDYFDEIISFSKAKSPSDFIEHRGLSCSPLLGPPCDYIGCPSNAEEGSLASMHLTERSSSAGDVRLISELKRSSTSERQSLEQSLPKLRAAVAAIRPHAVGFSSRARIELVRLQRKYLIFRRSLSEAIMLNGSKLRTRE